MNAKTEEEEEQALKPVLLTSAEAAKRLNVSEKTLYGWRKKSIGPVPTSMGSGYRYREDFIDAYILENTKHKEPQSDD